MITKDRLAELAVGRESLPMKAELLELVQAYRADWAQLKADLETAEKLLLRVLSRPKGARVVCDSATHMELQTDVDAYFQAKETRKARTHDGWTPEPPF